MSKTTKVTLKTGGLKGFFAEAREHARALDRHERIKPSLTITFEDAGDMLRVLSAERVRLLRSLEGKPSAVSGLASGLKRDLRAVSRDVDLLESFGLISTRYESNPGHGRRKIVEPRAERLQLIASI